MWFQPFTSTPSSNSHRLTKCRSQLQLYSNDNFALIERLMAQSKVRLQAYIINLTKLNKLLKCDQNVLFYRKSMQSQLHSFLCIFLFYLVNVKRYYQEQSAMLRKFRSTRKLKIKTEVWTSRIRV